MMTGVLSTSSLTCVLVHGGSQALSQRRRYRLGDGVRRADDDVTAQFDALQLRRLVTVNPDEQSATSLPRRVRDAMCQPELRRPGARPCSKTTGADGQLHVDTAAGHWSTRHRVNHHASVGQPLDVARPQNADGSFDAAAVASHVDGRHVAEVSDVVRGFFVGDLDALSRSEQIHLHLLRETDQRVRL